MQDRIYLLSLKEADVKTDVLTQKGAFTESGQAGRPVISRILERIDIQRRLKACRLKSEKKQLESAAAGLLLQYAVQEAVAEREAAPCSDIFTMEKTTLSDLLEKVQEPLELQYTYGKNGKPYLKNYPYFFSLSHSGGFVLCAVSKTEIGADIQQIKECDAVKLAGRFFSEREKGLLQNCDSQLAQLDAFYELWACKEAYGKLAGEGIGGAVGMDMSACIGMDEAVFMIGEQKVCVRRAGTVNGYKAVVCGYRN